MIRTVFRQKTKGSDGTPEVARLYRGRYRMDGESKITDVPLHTTDKRIAEQRLEQIIRDKQMEKSGMIAPESIRNAALSPMEKHLEQYIADLRALNRDPQYVNELNCRVRKLIRECHWTLLRDVTSDSFQMWRARQRRAPKTLNEYLGSISSFLSWLEKHERIPKNPLKFVQKVQTNGKQVRPRRAFTEDEMSRLLNVAGPRKVLYLTAVFTGLRRTELRKLARDDVHLSAEKNFLNVRASTTKNHKQAVLALHPDVVKEITTLLRQLPKSEEMVFAHLMPNMDQFRADLKAAEIPFIDRKGLRADFHSLRHTLATNLAKAGTAPRVAMEIMRHSDMRLTAKTYTDAGLLPIADAVLDLPSLMKPSDLDPKSPSQIASQNLVSTGQNESEPVTKSASFFPIDLAENQTVKGDKSTLVPTCPKNGKNGQNRIRTCEGKARRFTVFPRWPLGYLPEIVKARGPSRVVKGKRAAAH